MLDFLKKLPPWLRLGLIFPLTFLNGWLIFTLLSYFQPLSSIFVASALLAFLLDLPVRILVNQGVKRGWAISTVFLLKVMDDNNLNEIHQLINNNQDNSFVYVDNISQFKLITAGA